MGRLLREEDVLKIIRNGWSNHQSCKEMCDEIVCLPTAFNVEAVVKELEELKGQAFLTLANTDHAVFDFAYNQVLAYLDRAIEILKGGVK